MDWLAVDWGTTNRRVFRIEAGRRVATERDGRGTGGAGVGMTLALVGEQARPFAAALACDRSGN